MSSRDLFHGLDDRVSIKKQKPSLSKKDNLVDALKEIKKDIDTITTKTVKENIDSISHQVQLLSGKISRIEKNTHKISFITTIIVIQQHFPRLR